MFYDIGPFSQFDPNDILEILEGSCLAGCGEIEANPLLGVLLHKILVRFYTHLWSLEYNRDAP
jgi:hypothetical protein